MSKFILAGLALVINHEQPDFVGFQPLLSQQQQAKSGVIEVDETADPAIAALAVADPLRTTLGAFAADAFRATDNAQVAVIHLTNELGERSIYFDAAAEMAAAFTAADAVSGTDAAAVLTFDGGELNGASMSNSVANGTGLSTVINAMIATRKPTFTMASAINGLEDLVLADETKDALVFVDQTNNVIKVLTGVPAQIEAARAAAVATLANKTNFTQNAVPASTAPKLFGE